MLTFGQTLIGIELKAGRLGREDPTLGSQLRRSVQPASLLYGQQRRRGQRGAWRYRAALAGATEPVEIHSAARLEARGQASREAVRVTVRERGRTRRLVLDFDEANLQAAARTLIASLPASHGRES